jgi:hypothetical protein
MKRPDDIGWITALTGGVSAIAWAIAMLTRQPEDECMVGYLYLTGYLYPLVWVCAAFAVFALVLLAVQTRRAGLQATFSNVWGTGTLLLVVPGAYFAVLTVLSLIELLPVFTKH